MNKLTDAPEPIPCQSDNGGMHFPDQVPYVPAPKAESYAQSETIRLQDKRIDELKAEVERLKELHNQSVAELHRSFSREAATRAEMERREARGNNRRTTPQAGWDELRHQLNNAKQRIAELTEALKEWNGLRR